MGAVRDSASNDWTLEYPKYHWNEVWGALDSAKLSAYQEWTNTMLSHRALSAKVREFVIIALDCAVAWPEPYVDGHLNAAFDAGGTVNEVAEVIEVAGYIMGVHALNHGFTSLDRVVQTRREAGLIVGEL